MRGTIQLPTGTGSANWSGSGADPDTGFVYVPSKTHAGHDDADAAAGRGSRAGRRSRRSTARRCRTCRTARSVRRASIRRSPQPPTGPQGLPLVKPPYSRMTAYNTEHRRHRLAGADRPGRRTRSAITRRCSGVDAAAARRPGRPGGPLVTKTLLVYGLDSSGRGRGGREARGVRQGDRRGARRSAAAGAIRSARR